MKRRKQWLLLPAVLLALERGGCCRGCARRDYRKLS